MKHKVIAETLLRNEVFKIKIAGSHYEFAKEILESETLSSMFNENDLLDIFRLTARAHVYDFAKEILNNEALSSTFEARDLHCILCLTEKTHASELFKIILNNKNLLSLLGVSDIASIAMYCFEAGKHLLLDKEKAFLLTGRDLKFFLNHVELGKIILENKVFLAKIHKDDLIFFHEKPLGLVEKILSNERLQSRMREISEQNAKRVLDCASNVRSFAKKIKEGPLFDTLLEPLIESILKHLSFDMRKRMREVCVQWNRLVDAMPEEKAEERQLSLMQFECYKKRKDAPKKESKEKSAEKQRLEKKNL